jgi:hypothetical protein
LVVYRALHLVDVLILKLAVVEVGFQHTMIGLGSLKTLR